MAQHAWEAEPVRRQQNCDDRHRAQEQDDRDATDGTHESTCGARAKLATAAAKRTEQEGQAHRKEERRPDPPQRVRDVAGDEGEPAEPRDQRAEVERRHETDGLVDADDQALHQARRRLGLEVDELVLQQRHDRDDADRDGRDRRRQHAGIVALGVCVWPRRVIR